MAPPDDESPLATRPPVLDDLALSRHAHDRLTQRRPEEGLIDDLLARPDTRLLPVHDGRVAVTGDSRGPRLDLQPADRLGALGSGRAQLVLLGEAAGSAVMAAGVPAGADPGDELRWAPLREVVAGLGVQETGLAVQAVALDNWHRTHGYCPRCGAATVPLAGGHERRCPADGRTQHPRTDPAVIMLVEHEDRLLLARQASWPEGRYSLLAGFVEPGESLEAAVVRETREESGVDVHDVRYLGSQPWPFPASLMVGFLARARTDLVTVDGEEIVAARWVARADLPGALGPDLRLPPRLSIARRMIEWWAGGRLDDEGTWR